MAVPKKRTSKAKKNKRRFNWIKKAIDRSLKMPSVKHILETMVEKRTPSPKGFQ